MNVTLQMCLCTRGSSQTALGRRLPTSGMRPAAPRARNLLSPASLFRLSLAPSRALSRLSLSLSLTGTEAALRHHQVASPALSRRARNLLSLASLSLEGLVTSYVSPLSLSTSDPNLLSLASPTLAAGSNARGLQGYLAHNNPLPPLGPP